MKVLIISHNPLCTYNNMGKTLLSLFSEFNKEELCQLYIYPSVPDVDQCSSYYRITDKDVLKGCLTFHVKGGVQKPDLKNHAAFEDPTDEARYRDPKNKGALRALGRDLMWGMAHWFNQNLKRWIEEQRPTCIFLAPGKSKFIYDVALKISKKYQLPIAAYFADDYYFVRIPEKMLERIQLKLLKRKMRCLSKSSIRYILICEEMRQLYENEFCVSTDTVMTGASIPIVENSCVAEQPNVITYMGNIRCNRWCSIADIGRALDTINRKNGTGYALHLYSGETDPDILSAFDGIDSIQVCGYVSGAEYQTVFNSAEMFLHVEAFDEESIDLVKHSISTKIADCLASGKRLIAYGPSNVASIHYLQRNGCAYVISERCELTEQLEKVFDGDVNWSSISGRALTAARENHCARENSFKLKEILYG